MVALPGHPPLTPISRDRALSQTSSIVSIGTPEWDNFENKPTYELDKSFWDSRKYSETDPAFLEYRQPKIQIVDTSYSDFESETTMSPPAEPKVGNGHVSGVDNLASPSPELKQLITIINKDVSKLGILMMSFSVGHVNEATVCSVEPRLKEIRDLHIDIWTKVADLCSEYSEQLGEILVAKMQNEISSQNEKVNAHETEIRTKVMSLTSSPVTAATPVTAPPAPSSYEQELLKAQQLAAESQKRLMDLEIEKREREIKENTAKIYSKAALFKSKVKSLEGLIKIVETRDNSDYWVEADDDTIISSMKSMESWDKVLSLAEQAFSDFDQLVNVYGEPDDSEDHGYDLHSLKELLLALRLDFKEAKDTIVQQDKDRGLFSLSKISGEVLKYPSFSGDAGQDLVKFKEKMIYRFKRNQVCKIDQLEKLRENLKGKALRLVPDSMKDVDSAWSALQEAFGDPSRVLQHRLSSLRKLGDLPPESLKGAPNFENRVEYLLKFENIVEDIIELGKSDEDLYMLSFNANTVAEVVNKFPNDMVLKLNKLSGKGKDRLINIHNKIKEFRSDAQSLQKTRSINLAPVQQSASGKNKPERSSGGGSAMVMYNPPKREAACRVCCHLRDVSGVPPVAGTVFYEDHISNYVTGCPQFINLDMSARLKLATEIKLCHRCFHPDVLYNKDHDKQCSVNTDKKHSFSCTKCKMHSWICKYHKQDNKSKLDKFKKDYREKYKLRLVFTASMPKNLESAIDGSVDHGLEAHFEDLDSINLVNERGLETNIISGDQSSASPEPRAYSATLKAMKKRLRQAGFKGEIMPPPEGEPMFLFQAIQGKTAPVNTFYDNGCSHAVFKAGIPENQLRGRVTQKGPFYIKGVGGVVTHAHDQWLVALDMEDGNKQLVSGLTVDAVTADFPMIDLSEAVQEVKDHKPQDKFLQSCTLPKVAGGSTDILLGIKYSRVFPVMVHQLPSGLAIYKCILSSHGDKYNCLIGGPHRSFEVVVGQAGSTAALLAHFAQGLEQYKTWGPPKINSLPFTNEEEDFANNMNLYEGDTKEFYAHQKFKEIGHIVNEIIQEGCSLPPHLSENLDDVVPIGCLCFEMPLCCGNIANMDSMLSNVDADQVRHLKLLLQTQDSGLSVEYRCVRCRECWACKNADETEKLSLREEQENQLVRESVHLNFKNKSIDCTLPCRGEEADFLTTNKDLALKVLDSVCNRYHKDESVKTAILTAFGKLFDKGFAKLLDDLSSEQKQTFISKDPQYFIPWRCVFTDSVTTPCRPVLDASSRTRKRPDGSGGRCLNDLVVKGSVNCLDLLRLVLRWQIGSYALNGDLSQYYNSFKLDSKQWNLQRFLWKNDLDPAAEVKEGVITTLIYGVKSVSAQAEDAIKQLAEVLKKSRPNVSEFLLRCLYVDDMGESRAQFSECKQLAQEVDECLQMVGLSCKGWTFSSEDPPESIAKDSHNIKVGGIIWTPKVDVVEIPIPILHFGRRSRGKLDEKTTFFDGDFADLNKFVPVNLSRRMVTSKMASIYDVLGKFAPLTIGFKSDLRKVVLATQSWDEAMDSNLRNKWLENLWKVEQLRGIKFHRPRMPDDAVSSSMRLITAVDAAEVSIMIGCWGSFQRKDGTWSSQHIIGRGLLAPPNGTIPKNELEALCGGSNLSWVVRKALGDWVTSNVLIGDSLIALCWTTSENKRLSMFHRNRVVQIRRGTALDELYHVKTSENPSDIGTRPEKVSISDVGPDSMWENGCTWMRGTISQALEDGILVSAQDLRLNKDDQEEYSKGLVFDSQIPEVLTRGHVVNQGRLALIEERAQFSNYLIVPTKFSFPRTVRIYGYVMMFVTKCKLRCREKVFTGDFLKPAEIKFSAFACNDINFPTNVPFIKAHSDGDAEGKSLISVFTSDLIPQCASLFKAMHAGPSNIVTDQFLNMALTYLFRKATAEVYEFCSSRIIKNHTVVKDGILLSKNRLVDCIDFTYTGELKVDLGSLGIKANTPVIERYSPLAYSVAQHVHWNLAPHRGIETHNRVALEHVHIRQAMTLFRELSIECIRCSMRRKRLLEVSMGGLSSHQLNVAPPFHVTQMDLFGPYYVFVPGFERETRNRQVRQAKVWIMCSVCPTSRLVNLQVIEKSDAGGILCGVTRLACEVGLPKFFLIDQHDATMSAFANAELDYRDLELKLHRQYGILFEYCAVGGHESHGMVERIIRSVQQGLTDCGLETYKLHATGLQTLCKIVENSYNSVPIGLSYDRDQDNTGVLKIICPNMLRMGRSNQRSLDGPIRLAKGTRELLDRVENMYDAWFKIWQETVVPKLIFQPKWYMSDRDLQEEDIVYFQKKEGHLDSKWTVGRVDQVVRGRDGRIRKVIIRYSNASEENMPRFTERSVRKLVKLFSIDEHQVQEDLTLLQRRIDRMQHEIRVDGGESPGVEVSSEHDGEQVQVAPDVQEEEVADIPAANTRSKGRRCNCCCKAHCKLTFHSLGPVPTAYFGRKITCKMLETELVGGLVGSAVAEEDWLEEDTIEGETGILGEESLHSVLTSLNLVM